MSASILAVDTNTEACSVGLLLKGKILTRFEIAPRQHNLKILPMIEELLAEAGLSPNELDAIAMGRGPGAFTGVRITAGIVQGLAFGLDKPVVPVSSLAALAQGIYRTLGVRYVLPAIDARMDEIYWGAYKVGDHVPQILLSERVTAYQEMEMSDAHLKSFKWVGVGTGWQYHEHFQVHVSQFYPQELPHAEDILKIAEHQWLAADMTFGMDQAVPVYLRNDVATPKR